MTKYKKFFLPVIFCACALLLLNTSNLRLSKFVAKADWQTENSPDTVEIRSPQRNHAFYQGQPVTFQLNAPNQSGNPATRYVVRDYQGEIQEEGAATTNLSLKVRQPGWYKLYLFGNRTRPPWGDVVGGTSFVIFRDTPGFPKVPSNTPPAAKELQPLGQLKLSRLDRNIDFDWGDASPAPGLPVDNFFVRWSGYLRPQKSQTVTFYTTSDDGVRLWLDDRLLIDDWKEHGPTENKAQIALQTGRSYRIRLEYFEKGYGALMQLRWAGADQQKTILGAPFLSVDAAGQEPGLKGEYFVPDSATTGHGVHGTYYPSMDPIMRNITGMGPQRHFVEDAAKPDEAIAKLAGAIELDRQQYLSFDPQRRRALMIAFPNGTENLAGVRKIVERFKKDVKYWEPRNEPNGVMSGAQFATREMKPFYETVKSVDPTLKVLGPGTVTLGPNPHGLPWIEDFFKAGGTRYIDAFSFHAYNNVNGDVWLARHSLQQLQALLKKYNLENIEKWQTEQGYFGAMYGAYLPRHQGHWTMVQMMVYEQFGIPKEHNHYWYDKSHGFWDQPTWWQNDDGSLNPAAPLLRVWSEELYGTRFARAFDFGEPGNKMYVGSLFQGPNKTVAAFMSAGSPQGKVELLVRGGNALRVVSAFGVTQTLPVVAGKVLLSVPELPVYVELAAGQSLEVVPANWGANLARIPGVTATADGSTTHPQDRAFANPITKIHNGALENWYWSQAPADHPWMSNVPRFPAAVELRLPARTALSRVVIYAAPPWQNQSTLLSYDLQYEENGQWKTIEQVREPARTYPVWSPPLRTKVDSFFSGRWIFEHHLPTITTQKLRLLVHDVTWGGGATEDVVKAGGQTGLRQIVLREVELYAR